MSDNSLERQIQKMMEGLEFKPEAAVWEKVKAELAPSKKKPLLNWRVPLLFLLLAGVSTGIWMLWNNNTPAGLAVQKEKVHSNETTVLNEEGTINRAGSANPGTSEAANPSEAKSSGEINSPTGGAALSGADHLNKEGKQNEVIQSVTNKAGEHRTIAVHSQSLSGSDATTKEDVAAANTAGVRLAKAPSTDKIQKPAAPIVNAQFVSSDDTGSLLLYQVSPEIVTMAHTRTVTPAATVKLSGNQQQQWGQHTLVNKPVIIKAADRSGKWSFMPFLAGGIAKINGDDDGGISTYEKAYYDNLNSTFTPTAGAPVAVRAVVNYATKLRTGKAYSIGLLADHNLIGKLSFQTGLRYQFINYSTFTVTNTDSIGRLGNGYASISASTISGDNSYRMHYLGIPIFLHYDLTNPVGITAGVINDFMAGANKDGKSLQGAMRNWNPNAYFAFVINIPGSDKFRWKIMPYMQYGLKPLSKTGNQNLLQPGLQVSLQLNNK